jgi:hypothetical protein
MLWLIKMGFVLVIATGEMILVSKLTGWMWNRYFSRKIGRKVSSRK